MLTDDPVNVTVGMRVIHFVAVREMSEVRNLDFFHFILFVQ